MKYLLTNLLLLISVYSFTQTDLPAFLAGTWKMENQETYEHWDILNKNAMKGFSYKIKNGMVSIAEYGDIHVKNGKLTYTSTVIGQNDGKSIDFTLTQKDDAFTFENPLHDFPKILVYKKLSDTEVYVKVSDGKQYGFSYKMQKQSEKPVLKDSTVANPNYDKGLADKLGGDDYGMKSYFLVILKTGSNTITDQTFISTSFRGHLDNINRLVEEDKLIIAGPLGKNERNYRGIFVLQNIASIEAAKEVLQTDPAVKAGLLEAEIYNWYGSAALPEYLDISDKIWKKKP